MLWFLATTIIWHTGGNDYKEIASVTYAHNQAVCEMAAEQIKAEYAKKQPMATIYTICLPVRRIVVS